MEFKNILQKKVSKKKFLTMLAGTIFAVPLITKNVMAKTFLRKVDGTLIPLDDIGAGGATTNVQFNDDGAFGGASDFTWDKTSKEFKADGSVHFNASGADKDFLFGASATDGNSKMSFDFGKSSFAVGLINPSTMVAYTTCIGRDCTAVSVGSVSFGRDVRCEIGSGLSGGNFSQGLNYGGTIKSTGGGCFSQGKTLTSGIILAGGSTGFGCFAQGSCDAYTTVEATAKGSFAQGNGVTFSGGIKSQANGSFAQGGTYYRSGSVLASGVGSFAQGASNCYNGGNVEATEPGAFAQGIVTATGLKVSASGDGAFAHGKAATASIIASASNSSQFGEGTNAIANSLQVGGGVSLRATGNIVMKETTAVASAAGFGQLYMKNVSGTTELWFVNDAGGAAKII